MRFIIQIFLSAFYCVSITTSCSSRPCTMNDMVGLYVGERNPLYNKDTIDWSRESIMAYLCGDSTKHSYSYIVYHNLPGYHLSLESDSTFSFGIIEFVDEGKWYMIGKDTIVLSFRPIPKNPASIMAVSLGRLNFEGTRELRIVNKNELQYEYVPFHAPDSLKVVTTFKRKKRKW